MRNLNAKAWLTLVVLAGAMALLLFVPAGTVRCPHLGFPMLQFSSLLNAGDSGWLLIVFNSILWGVAAGTCISFLFGERVETTAAS